MKRFISLILVLTFVLGCTYLPAFATTGSKTAEEGSDSEIDYTPTEVVWSDPYATGLAGGYPRLTTGENGSLIIAYEKGQTICVARSSNDGKDWPEAARHVAYDFSDTGYSVANPAPYYDAETATVYLAFRSPRTLEDGSHEANIGYITSTDNGNTWSSPVYVASSVVPDRDQYGGMWEPTIYRIEGQLRIYYSCDTAKYGSGTVYINPKSANETLDATFPYVSSTGYQNIVMHSLDETTGLWSGAVCVSDGEEHYPYSHKFFGYSGRDGMQSITRLSDGTYAMVVETNKNYWGDKYGDTHYKFVIDISFSRDGISFTDPVSIAVPRAEGYSNAAPWIETLPGGRIVISYQTDEHNESPAADGDGLSDRAQLEVIVSKAPVTYADASSIGEDDFDSYKPFDAMNSSVTYNSWNCVFVRGYKVYAVGRVRSKDTEVSPHKDIVFSTFDSAYTDVPAGYMPIYTANDFAMLMNRDGGYVWHTSKYILMDDIDLSDVTNGFEFSPVGIVNQPGQYFLGTFDGNGHSITLKESYGSAYVGLFGYCVNATIKDLTVYGSITSTYTGAASRANQGIGAIAGHVNGKTTISNCVNYAEVTGNATVGGIIGYAFRNGSTVGNVVIENCENYGKITSLATEGAKGAAGGIVGDANTNSFDIEINDCVNHAAVSGRRYVGGIVGGMNYEAGTGETNVIISRCTNLAPVTVSDTDCGGIVGIGWHVKVYDCVNLGAVTRTVTNTSVNFGGIVGRSHQAVVVERCINDASVMSSGGSIVGTGNGATTEKNNFYPDRYTYTNTLGTALTDIRFAVAQSFTGFDFENVYTMEMGVPRLRGCENYVYYDESYIPLSTPEDVLELMNTTGVNITASYVLTCDIDLSEYTGELKQRPIGGPASTEAFRGVFEGNGHTIKGIDIQGYEKNAFFGMAIHAYIRNLTIEITSASANIYTGGLCSIINGATTIENCKVYGTVAGQECVGGFVGTVLLNANTSARARIVGCSNHADVSSSAKQKIGGFVGYVVHEKEQVTTIISGCTNFGNVTAAYAGEAYLGGFVGLARNAFSKTTDGVKTTTYGNGVGIIGCTNFGNVTATAGGRTGGFIASANDDTMSRSLVMNCVNYGNVSGTRKDVGGIVAVAINLNVIGCVNYATITNNGVDVGAIVARMHNYSSYKPAEITNNYDLSGKGYVVIGSAEAASCANYLATNNVAVSENIGTLDTFAGLDSGMWYATAYGPMLDSVSHDECVTRVFEKAATVFETGSRDTVCVIRGELITSEIIDKLIAALGDVDGDGIVSNADITVIVRILSGYGDRYAESAIDVNEDGKFNNRDVLSLIIALNDGQ